MIKGWVRTTLIDYPGEIASSIFLGGCNFRCPMCHNADLVLNPEHLADIPTNVVLDYLGQRTGRITGAVISGGEPCLSRKLPSFLRELRALNMKIKLDTNGYWPEALAALLEENLVDYIAMDIKAPPEKYDLLTGIQDLDLSRICSSIDLLLASDIACEFRTTVVNAWITTDDIFKIAQWLHGARRYVLQQFRPQGCLGGDLNGRQPYPEKILREMQEIAGRWIPDVLLRGV